MLKILAKFYLKLNSPPTRKEVLVFSKEHDAFGNVKGNSFYS